MRRNVRVLLTFLVLGILWTLPAFAQTANPSQPKIDSGDTAWMLASAALVLFMTIPGLALFYGGLVRTKNVLGHAHAKLHYGRYRHGAMDRDRLQSGICHGHELCRQLQLGRSHGRRTD